MIDNERIWGMRISDMRGRVIGNRGLTMMIGLWWWERDHRWGIGFEILGTKVKF